MKVARANVEKTEKKQVSQEKSMVTDNEMVESASRRKIESHNEDKVKAPDHEPASQQWLLGHISQLNKLIDGLVCPDCGQEGLEISIDPNNKGYCTALLLVCTLCPKGKDQFRKTVFTSPRIQDSEKGDVAFEINTRMVFLAHQMGLGYAALEKFSKVLGIPGMHLKTYQRHDRKVTGMENQR